MRDIKNLTIIMGSGTLSVGKNRLLFFNIKNASKTKAGKKIKKKFPDDFAIS